MKLSQPISNQSGQNITFKANKELKESLSYLSNDLPLAVYTQAFDHATSDAIPIHWHDEIQLTWLISGKLEYTINDETLTLTPNTLLFLNKHQLHSSKSTTHDAFTLCINFENTAFSDFIKNYFLNPILNNNTFSYALIPMQPQQIEKLKSFTTLADDPLQYLSVLNFISQTIEQVIPIIKSQHQPINQKEVSIFYTMIDYIHTHYAEPLTVTEIAKYALTNKNRCTALFNKYANTSPIKYVNSHRLHQAKDLLLHSEQSVSEISLNVGFNQLSHFIELFRKQYGLSPLKYRTQYNKK